MATAPTPAPSPMAGYATAAGSLLNAYAASEASKAAAINQQTGLLLQARDALAVANVRAQYSEQYTAIQAGRTLKKAEIEAQNYTIAGNQLLKNLRSTNASLRARAAANGVSLASGSISDIQQQNVDATMRDVAVADFNSLAARVFGFEDASAMMESTQIQNIINDYTAKQGYMQAELTGAAGVKSAGLLANARLVDTGITALRTVQIPRSNTTFGTKGLDQHFFGSGTGGIKRWQQDELNRARSPCVQQAVCPCSRSACSRPTMARSSVRRRKARTRWRSWLTA